MKRYLCSIGILLSFVMIYASTVKADCPSPMDIAYGDYVQCEISQVGEADIFKFYGEVGDRILLHVTDSNWMCGFGVDPVVEFYDPDGIKLYWGSDCARYILRPDEGLPKNGQYTIVVSGGVSPYALSLERLSDPFGPEVKYGDPTLSDQIESFGVVDLFTFYGCADDLIRLQVTDSNWMCGFGVDPVVEIYYGDGSPGPSGSSCDNVVIETTLPEEGWYSIVVWGGTDSYSLDLDLIVGGQCIPYGLQVDVILNQNEFTTGEELVVSVRITNGNSPAIVEVKIWVQDANNRLIALRNLPKIVIPANSESQHIVLQFPFGGSEPVGTYWVGANFIDPITGKTKALDQEQFSFNP